MDVQGIFNAGGVTIKNPNYSKSKKNSQPEYITVTDINSINKGITNSGMADIAYNAESQYQNVLGEEKDLAKYANYGITPNAWEKDLDVQLANAQSNWAKAFNALGQTVISEIGLGTLRGFTDLFDIIINGGVGYNNNDYTNPVSAKIKEWQDEFNNNIAPIYQDPNKTWGDFGWWMSNIPSIMSSLTLMVPGMGVSAATSKLSKVVGLTGKAKKLMSAKDFSRASRFVNFGINGTTSRILENYQEANQVYSDMLPEAYKRLNDMNDAEYNAYIKRNQDKLGDDIDLDNRAEVAKRIAKVSADETFKDDLANVVFDVYQLYGLRNLKQFMNGANRTKIRRAAINRKKYAGKSKEEVDAILEARPKYKKIGEKVEDIVYGGHRQFLSEASEGVEEAVNFIAQEEGMHYGNVLLEKEKDDSTFGKRLKDYMAAPGLYESAFWGVVGGFVFQNLGSGVARLKRSYDAYHKNKANTNKETEEQFNIWQSLKMDDDETTSRVKDIDSAYSAFITLKDKINQIKTRHEDPYTQDPVTKKAKQLETQEERDLAIEKVFSEYTHTLLVNSMFTGNWNLTKEYLQSEEVKKAMVDAGIISKEEADKRQREIAEMADKIEKSYDRNMKAIENALDSEDKKTGIDYKEIPYEYYQIIAAENMQHEFTAEQYQKAINAHLGIINSEETRLTTNPDGSATENNPLIVNGIHVKDAIHAYIISQQLGEVEAEIEALNKTEREGRISSAGDNRYLVGQSKLEQLKFRKEVLLSMLNKDGGRFSTSTEAIIAMRAAAATEMKEDGRFGINYLSERYRKVDDIIVTASLDSVSDSVDDESKTKSREALNKLLENTGISFKTNNEVAEAMNQVRVFEENLQALIGEDKSVLNDLDELSKQLKDKYAVLTYSQIERTAELKQIATTRDAIIRAAYNRHNEANQARAVFNEIQNNTIKRLARDYSEEYNEEAYGVPLSTVLARAPFNENYNNILSEILTPEDRRIYDDAIKNLAITKPVNAKLADYIENTIKASEFDNFIEVENFEAGHTDKDGEATDKVLNDEEVEEKDEKKDDKKSTTPKRTDSATETPKPITTSPKPVKPDTGEKNGEKHGFTTNKNGKLWGDLYIDDDEKSDNFGEVTKLLPHERGSVDSSYSPDLIPTDDEDSYELDFLNEEPEDIENILTNKNLFDIKQPITLGGKLITNPIVTLDDKGNVVSISKGVIANPESADAAEAEADSSKGREKPTISEKEGLAKELTNEDEESNNEGEFGAEEDNIFEGVDREVYNNTMAAIQEAASDAIAIADMDGTTFNMDDFIESMIKEYSSEIPAAGIRKMIDLSRKYIDAELKAFNVKSEESKHITDFIAHSVKKDTDVVTGFMSSESAKHAIENTFKKIIDDYTKRAFVAEIDGKKVISLANLLKYCNVIVGNENFANIIYDKFVEQLYEDSDKYILIEKHDDINNHREKILNNAKITETEDLNTSSRRIGVEWFLKDGGLSKADQAKVMEALNKAKPGDKLTYKVKGWGVEIIINGQPLGRLQVPKITDGSYDTINKGWKVDIPVNEDGTQSRLENLFIEIFDATKHPEIVEVLNKNYYTSIKKNNDKNKEEKRLEALAEIYKVVKDSGILDTDEFRNCENRSKGHTDSDLGEYLLNIYRYVKTKGDSFLAKNKMTREELEAAYNEDRINSIKQWFGNLKESYQTAIRLFNNPSLSLEIEHVNQGALNIIKTPRVITEPGVIGAIHKDSITIAASSISEPGTIYLSNGERLSDSTYTPGSTNIAIRRNDGTYAMAHAFPVSINAPHLRKNRRLNDIHNKIIKEFTRLITEWQSDPETSVNTIFDFIDHLTKTSFNDDGSNSHNALFKGIKVSVDPAGYKQLEYVEDGERKFIKFYRSKFDSTRGRSAVIQFSGERPHSFNKPHELKEVIKNFTDIINNNLKYNIDFGYVKGQQNLSGAAKRTSAGKFVINIPGVPNYTFNSYQDFIIENGLVAVTTEAKDGNTNFKGFDVDDSKQKANVTFRILEDSTPPVEDSGKFESEPEDTRKAGDEVKQLLENKIEGEDVTDKVVSLLLDNTKLNTLKKSGLIKRLSEKNVIFVNEITAGRSKAIAAYDKTSDTIKLSQIWVDLANDGVAGREQAFRQFIHENVHRKIEALSDEDKAQLFNEVKEIIKLWTEANKRDGYHKTQSFFTGADNKTLLKRYVDNGEFTDDGIEEFIVESITRPIVMRRLNEIPVDGKTISDKTFGNIKSKNLLQQILSVIATLFNVNLNKGSLLEKEYKIFSKIGALSDSTTKTEDNTKAPPAKPKRPEAPKDLGSITSETISDNLDDPMAYSEKLDNEVASLAQIRDSLNPKLIENFDKLKNANVFTLTC